MYKTCLLIQQNKTSAFNLNVFILAKRYKGMFKTWQRKKHARLLPRTGCHPTAFEIIVRNNEHCCI